MEVICEPFSIPDYRVQTLWYYLHLHTDVVLMLHVDSSFFFFGLLCVPDYNNSFPFVVAVVILIPLLDFF